jgi:DNA-directed RNA polymerase subunit L
MEVKILIDEKNELEIQLDNQTVAELLRGYLNQDESVKLGVWKKEHYSRPLKLKVISEGKTAKKALQDAITKAKKDLDKYSDELKKAK